MGSFKVLSPSSLDFQWQYSVSKIKLIDDVFSHPVDCIDCPTATPNDHEIGLGNRVMVLISTALIVRVHRLLSPKKFKIKNFNIGCFRTHRSLSTLLDLKVIYSIGIFCSRQMERYQNHKNRTSVTYLKLTQFYLITLVKVKCQGHFLGLFCIWSYVFPSFAWNSRSPVAI